MNLRELAQHLGLSKTTVSRALNGFSEVNEETRLRVVEAARRFNYTPNVSAKRLATGESGAFGVVLPGASSEMADPVFAEFLAGLADGAGRCGRDLYVNATFDGEEAGYRRLARAKAVDVMILANLKVEDLRIRLLSHLGLQTVTCGRTAGSLVYPHLDIDHEDGVRRAVDLLAGLGHRTIVLVSGPADLSASEQRMVGWHAALGHRGLNPAAGLFAAGPATEDHGYRATRALLALPEAPTAFLCASMFLASGCCRAIGDCGLKIGRDVSVIAHDDGLATVRPEAFDPPLTTTFSSIRAAGTRVAELAAALIGGADPATLSEVRPVDLIFRDSAQAPPRR